MTTNFTDEDGLKQGVWVTRFKGGNIQEKGEYIDDKKQGVWEKWLKKGDFFQIWLAILRSYGIQKYTHFSLKYKGCKLIVMIM